MTEPRRWTITPDYGDRPIVVGPPFHVLGKIPVLAVGPKDREAVEALIAQALCDHGARQFGDAALWSECRDDERAVWLHDARAVFDALAGNDQSEGAG